MIKSANPVPADLACNLTLRGVKKGRNFLSPAKSYRFLGSVIKIQLVSKRSNADAKLLRGLRSVPSSGLQSLKYMILLDVG